MLELLRGLAPRLGRRWRLANAHALSQIYLRLSPLRPLPHGSGHGAGHGPGGWGGWGWGGVGGCSWTEAEAAAGVEGLHAALAHSDRPALPGRLPARPAGVSGGPGPRWDGRSCSGGLVAMLAGQAVARALGEAEAEPDAPGVVWAANWAGAGAGQVWQGQGAGDGEDDGEGAGGPRASAAQVEAEAGVCGGSGSVEADAADTDGRGAGPAGGGGGQGPRASAERGMGWAGWDWTGSGEAGVAARAEADGGPRGGLEKDPADAGGPGPGWDDAGPATLRERIAALLA